jgi:hypothetical protein
MFVLTVLAVCGCRADRLADGPVGLGRWTAVNYRVVRDGQQYAKWIVGNDGQSVKQTNNADPSIFLSDRNLDRQVIEGTWLVEPGGDDDLIGFVFGYQDPGHFYVFDWKGESQGEARRGMSVKVVSTDYEGNASGELPPGKPFEEHELWATDGVAGKTHLLNYEDTVGWEFDRPYKFRLDFAPGEFRIIVADGDKTLYDRTHRDRTYGSGRFGFYNYSQGQVVYRGFETRVLPGQAVTWPAILTIFIILLVITAVLIAKRRRHGAG